MPANSRRKNPFLLAPALVFVILIFLVLVGFIDFDVKHSASAYLLTALLTLIVFGVPTGIYVFCRVPAPYRDWGFGVYRDGSSPYRRPDAP